MCGATVLTADTANDCRVAVSVSNPDKWLNICIFCNYESSCVYQYQNPNSLITCGGDVADYLEITYVCAYGKVSTCILIECLIINSILICAYGIVS